MLPDHDALVLLVTREMPFGKHKGMRVAEELGFARWMLRNDFAEETKALVTRVIRGEKVRREGAA